MSTVNSLEARPVLHSITVIATITVSLRCEVYSVTPLKSTESEAGVEGLG